jgi:hypothetical protein
LFTRQLRSFGPNLEQSPDGMDDAADALREDDKEMADELGIQTKRNFLAHIRGLPGDQVILRYVKTCLQIAL